MKILAINPGMISTKVGVFRDEELLMHATLNHPFEELCRYPFIMDEFDYRKEKVLEELQRQGCTMDFDVVVGRGGLVKPIESGVYELNDKVIEDTRHPRLHHACNLGSLMALSIARGPSPSIQVLWMNLTMWHASRDCPNCLIRPSGMP